MSIAFLAVAFLKAELKVLAEPMGSSEFRAENSSNRRGPGAGAPDLFSLQAFSVFWDDGKSIFTSPFRWDLNDWAIFGGASVFVGGSSALDAKVRHQTFNRRPTSLSKVYQKFGAEYSFAILAGFECVDLIADDETARAIVLDGVSASLLASGIITPSIKFVVGRYRPTETSRTFKYKPFGGKQSFPSGHATQAFAVATVIASHYSEWWVQALSYGMAAGVGYCRIDQRAHFLSDVSAGSLIGYFVARSVVKRNAYSPGGLAIMPFSTDGFTGLLASKQF